MSDSATPWSTGLPDGYRARAATRDDLDEIVAVVRASETAAFGSTTAGPGEVSSDWADRRFDMSRDTWVVERPGGGLAAYALCWGIDPVNPIDIAFEVHADDAGQGIEEHLIGLLLARARELAAARGPAARAQDLAAWCARDDRCKHALFEQLGFTRTRVFLRMEIAAAELPPAPAWPAGITVDPFRVGDDDSAVHAAINEAFSDHFLASAPPLDVWQTQVLGDIDFDPGLFLIARDGAEVAGAVLCFATPEVGIVDQLAVRRPWRGRGLGRALLVRALRLLAERGNDRLQLGVDSLNETGATQLYTSIGMTVTRTTDFYEGHL